MPADQAGRKRSVVDQADQVRARHVEKVGGLASGDFGFDGIIVTAFPAAVSSRIFMIRRVTAGGKSCKVTFRPAAMACRALAASVASCTEGMIGAMWRRCMMAIILYNASAVSHRRNIDNKRNNG